MKLDMLVPNSKGTKRWEKSIESEGGTTRRMVVEEIFNGFLITISVTNYRREPPINKTERVFSKKNPLENSKYTINNDGDIMGVIEDFFSDKKQLL